MGDRYSKKKWKSNSCCFQCVKASYNFHRVLLILSLDILILYRETHLLLIRLHPSFDFALFHLILSKNKSSCDRMANCLILFFYGIIMSVKLSRTLTTTDCNSCRNWTWSFIAKQKKTSDVVCLWLSESESCSRYSYCTKDFMGRLI